MILRPYGIVVSGKLEFGWEVEVVAGHITSVRPSDSKPDDYVLSAAFVNAHSHLEYRGFQDRITDLDYWPWIRKLTELKREQSPGEVVQDCELAAIENGATGVARIAEHTDRIGSAAALAKVGLKGTLFQELITVFEKDGAEARRAAVRQVAIKNSEMFRGPVHIAPHALFTVDWHSLTALAGGNEPFSIHVAESVHEREWLAYSRGPIADMYMEQEVDQAISGSSPVAALQSLGACRPGAQFVHCCDVDDHDIETMAGCGVAVAHCPRSNARLRCKVAPVRRIIEAGIPIGIGLDSSASSGPIDMFAEMRSACRASRELGEPISDETAWQLATNRGFESLANSFGEGGVSWDIEPGSQPDLVRIHVSGARSTTELLEMTSPACVQWVEEQA